MLHGNVFSFTPSSFHWMKCSANEGWQSCTDFNSAELLIYTRWASQPPAVARPEFIPDSLRTALDFWPVQLACWKQFTVKWWKQACVYFSAISLICDPSRNGTEWNLLRLLHVSPGIHVTMIHGTQAVMFTVGSSVFPWQPMSWDIQPPSQDLFIYTRS